MRCNYFSGTQCKGLGVVYAPTVEEKKEYCESKEFHLCPRFQAHLDVLQAKSG